MDSPTHRLLGAPHPLVVSPLFGPFEKSCVLRAPEVLGNKRFGAFYNVEAPIIFLEREPTPRTVTLKRQRGFYSQKRPYNLCGGGFLFRPQSISCQFEKFIAPPLLISRS